MTYAKIILAIISLIQQLLRIGQENKWIKVGEDRAIAAGLAETLRKTEFADAALKEITALPDAAIDNLLQSLEREPPPSQR